MQKWKQLAGIILLGLMFICMIQILFDPFSSYINQRKLDQLEAELTIAEEKWEAQHISNYSVEVSYFIPLMGICPGRITVKDSVVIKVEERSRGQDENSEYVIITKEKRENNWCYYTNLTIPEVFNRVKDKINDKVTIVALFDTEKGFVTRYYGNENVGWGLFNSRVSDSEFSYTFTNFQVLESEKP